MAVIVRFQCAGQSDAGRKRENNEDRFWADPDRGVFFVIDGVGGQAAGEKAADTACELLRARLERPSGTPAERIREGIALANNEIYRLAASNDQWHGMACVLTVAVLQDNDVTIGQVGDSRLYLILPGEIRKITRDHSPVGEREDRGEIDELTAMRHPRRNEVFRDVGSQEHAPDDPDFIEISTVQFPPEGALLLCSDGLSDLVTSKQILALIEQNAGNPKAAARALIDAANLAGGKDNITVVVVEGTRFAAGVRRRNSSPKTVLPLAPVRPPWYSGRIALFLYGALLAALVVAVLKPHWRDAGAGVHFGWGPVREARTWRVTNEINIAMVEALPGDTVLVAPGVYNEQIRLRDGIRLVSERPREALIRANTIAITAEGVRAGRIEGFKIQPDDTVFLQVGVQLFDSSVEVVDNEITGTVTAGVELQGSAGSVLRANTIEARSRAAVVIGGEGPGPRIVQNTLAAEDHPAVVISGNAKPVLSGNIIRAADPVFAPPHTDPKELLRGNLVAPISGSRSSPRPRSGARPVPSPAKNPATNPANHQDASSRVR